MSNEGATLELTPGSCLQLYRQLPAARPLIQCITNFVSMDIMANVLLAAGASPAMAHSLDEVEDFCSISKGLLINMGTLSSEWIASKKLAARQAVALGKPWVLDPVGCGATPVRTRACLDLLNCSPTVVRGNASEIMALGGAAGTILGVDSMEASTAALPMAMAIAQQHKCVVAVSGEKDFVTDGFRVAEVSNGVEMLTCVTAAGCAVTALIAAMVTLAPKDPVIATAAALAVFGLAGEMGSVQCQGPASLRVGLIDSLYQLRLDGLELGRLLPVRVSSSGKQNGAGVKEPLGLVKEPQQEQPQQEQKEQQQGKQQEQVEQQEQQQEQQGRQQEEQQTNESKSLSIEAVAFKELNVRGSTAGEDLAFSRGIRVRWVLPKAESVAGSGGMDLYKELTPSVPTQSGFDRFQEYYEECRAGVAERS